MLSLLAVTALAAAPVPRDVEVKVSGAQLTFVFRAGRFDGLQSQLLCLAKAYSCSHEAMLQLWRESMAWSADDDVALEHFKEALSAHQASSEIPADGAAAPLVGDVHWSLENRVAHAFLVARDEGELRSALTTLLGPQSVDGLLALTHRVQPRFDAWWAAKGLPLAARFAKQLGTVVTEGKLVPLAESVMRFYAPPLSGPQPIVFHLVPRFRQPGSNGGHTMATVIDRDAYVEFLTDERAQDRVDVVMHELFHFFLSARTPEQHRALNDAFAASAHPDAMSLYALVDEGLATTFGNGLVAQRVTEAAHFAKQLTQPESFYSNADIDGVAKAWFTRAAQWLEQGKTLGPQLVEDLISTAAPGVAKQRNTLGFIMRTRAFEAVNDDDMWAAKWLSNEIDGSSTYRDSGDEVFMLEQFPQLSGAVVVRWGELARLGKRPKLIDAKTLTALTSRPAGVFGLSRSVQADVYFIIAADKAGLDTQLKRLVAHGQRFTGWLSTPDAGP